MCVGVEGEGRERLKDESLALTCLCRLMSGGNMQSAVTCPGYTSVVYRLATGGDDDITLTSSDSDLDIPGHPSDETGQHTT